MLRFSLTILGLVSIASLATSKAITRTHPDVGLDIHALNEKYGYPLETYEVETEDGYLLTLHRIPHGKNNKDGGKKPPILLMHGILSSSTDWVNVGPEKALAYMLADRGYDVWMGNARGNFYSRKHKVLDPETDKSKFWDFSWNEIGKYDLPAKIDFILDHTENEKLQYVGFSQGTTVFLVMASSRPEYNDKVKLATIMAPAGEMSHIKNPIIKFLAKYDDLIYPIAKNLNLYEILPKSEVIFDFVLNLCDTGKPTQELCKLVVFAIVGYDREQLDGDFIPVIISNFPAGSSTKQFMHYAQIMSNPEFKQFDYHNPDKNIQVYGSAVPPVYDFSKITAPVAVYYGENDWLASDTDAVIISKKMPNVVKSHLVDYKAFTHLDFIWSIDIVELINNDVVEFIEQYR